MLKKIMSLIILVLVVAIYFYWQGHYKTTVEQVNPDAVWVDAELVENTTVPNVFETYGNLIANDRVMLTPQVAGSVANIYFQEGTEVKQGDQLIRLDTSVTEAELKSSQADLAFAQGQYDRISLLSQQGVDSRQAQEQALADLQRARNDVSVKRAKLQQMIIYAPFAGYVGERRISVGEYIDSGSHVLELVDSSKLIIEYTVPTNYLTELAVGQQVLIATDLYSDEQFEGITSFVSPSIDANSRTILVRATIDNEDNRLAPGLFVNVRHILSEAENSILVPIESLVPTIEGPVVYTIVNGQALGNKVEIGTRFPAKAQILSGLNHDDVIIVAGHHKLRDGTSVIVRESTTENIE